jgi:hypothetical protein
MWVLLIIGIILITMIFSSNISFRQKLALGLVVALGLICRIVLVFLINFIANNPIYGFGLILMIGLVASIGGELVK